MFSQAKSNTSDGLAYRYALKELNPFVMRGVDYQALHNSSGALDLYDTQTGQGTWTVNAVSDRAELLAKRLQVNINDDGTVVTDTHYVDVRTGFEVGSVASANEVIFGDDHVGEATWRNRQVTPGMLFTRIRSLDCEESQEAPPMCERKAA